eukprot:6187121-Alexandrium_andersonii.AAC.1
MRELARSDRARKSAIRPRRSVANPGCHSPAPCQPQVCKAPAYRIDSTPAGAWAPSAGTNRA